MSFYPQIGSGVETQFPFQRQRQWRAITTQLESGELILLNLPVGDTREVRLQLVRRDLSSSSVEVSALSEMLGVDRGAEVI